MRLIITVLAWSLLLTPSFSNAAPQPGAVEFLDAVPFGVVTREADGKTLSVRWEAPRKIRRIVVLGFPADSSLPAAESLRIEYWHRVWNGKPDPVLAEMGAGGVGWTRVDDWTNGDWKRAETQTTTEGRSLIFTFAPVGEKEIKNVGDAGVAYRKTLKLRLAGDAPLPAGLRLMAITDSVCRPLSVRLSFGAPADESLKLPAADKARIEVYNGRVEAIRPADAAGLDAGKGWDIPAEPSQFQADVIMAADPVDPRYDRTIVTVRSGVRPFSFAADEVARGDRILVDDLGVLVTRGNDPITIDEYRRIRKEYPGRTIYERVWKEPEQTLGRAWKDMPIKEPIWFVHGLPGDRNMIRHLPTGEIQISANDHWFGLQPSPRDTGRKKWGNSDLALAFGFPNESCRSTRQLEDGYLPLIRTTWQDGPVFYEQKAILDTLSGKLDTIALDDPTLLLMRIRVANTSDTQPGTARLRLTSKHKKGEKLTIDGQRIFAPGDAGNQFRCIFQSAGRGTTQQDGDAITWSLELKPGESHNLYVFIPSITLDKGEEISAIASRDFADSASRVCDFWRGLIARSTQIETPEPWLNDFYKSHARHLLVNCYKELDSDRLHAHVGSFRYGMYLNESAMMVSDLDRRGYHREAQQNVDSLLHYQGTVAFPGTYTSKEGMLYGDGGHEMGGYNKSHGYAMWLIAHHWRMTHDRQWMAGAADKLVKACEWVIRERQTTMKMNEDGSRPIEYGFLPTGSLEDVQDYWHWMATNAATVWGFRDLAGALAEFNHPRAAELQKEAANYAKDFMTGMTEARILTPVVRLRDGTYVPKYPSRLYERGRAYGWIREVLEGSIFMPAYKLIAPESTEARWIMQDFEDNLYISPDYSYQIPVFDEFWFSRGGFCMQANLLDSPLPYLYRDEIKHYLRTYFNAFASGFFPEVRMLNEHALPELGLFKGDHFKSSDEAQSTYWLRLMFVHERDGDLYLGQAIPRYWLADGKQAAIERAATEFGPMSLRYTSQAGASQIKAVLSPPTRNAPKSIYLRFRHPDQKPIQSVTVNGKEHTQFDVKKEWVILPGTLAGRQEVIVKY